MSSLKILFEKFRNKSHLFSTILIVTLIFSSFNFWNLVFATNITGIISTDTSWTEAGSPYVLTGNVLVDENVTLTIDPGTTVNLGSYYIQIDGTLIAQGTPSNHINLNSGEIRFVWGCQNWNETASSGCIIENVFLNSSYVDVGSSTVKINNCSMLNTNVFLGDGNSTVSDNTVIAGSISGGGLLSFGKIYSPKIVNNFIYGGGIGFQESFGLGLPLIESNFITNGETGITIIHSWLTATIRNNTITNNSIGISLNYANQNQTILYNNIYENLDYNLRLYNTGADINATYNWWGTTNTTLINQTIVDFYDDFPLGVVDFVPLLENPNPNAPIIPVDRIFAGGSYNDGVFDNSQVIVWDSETLGYEGSANWQWTNNTVVNSVALGDVDDDGVVEIVSGGSYNDGTFDNAQLIVWDSETLAYEGSVNWQWINNTCVNSVAIADIDDDGVVEIVSGGYYNDGTYDNAQIIVWSGETLFYEGSANWQWTDDTVVNSVSLADIDDDGVMEIVTGGCYNDGTFDNAQVIVWNGETLSYEGSANWQWTDDTVVNSICLADIDDDGVVEIVSGGSYNDGTYDNSQVIVWNGETLGYEGSANWQWVDDTCVNSVALADIDEDGVVEIVTGGYYNDGTYDNAQIIVWNGETLSYEGSANWQWIDNTCVDAVVLR